MSVSWKTQKRRLKHGPPKTPAYKRVKPRTAVMACVKKYQQAQSPQLTQPLGLFYCALDRAELMQRHFMTEEQRSPEENIWIDDARRIAKRAAAQAEAADRIRRGWTAKERQAERAERTREMRRRR